MMTGFVEPSLDAVVTLRVRGERATHEVEAVVDTGFNGWLSLPSALIRGLALEWQRSGLARLADGTLVDLDVYGAHVEWHGGWREIAVEEADTDPLIGMHLLRGSVLAVEVTEGGRVRIDPLPDDR